jgi:hypothetical protein
MKPRDMSLRGGRLDEGPLSAECWESVSGIDPNELSARDAEEEDRLCCEQVSATFDLFAFLS